MSRSIPVLRRPYAKRGLYESVQQSLKRLGWKRAGEPVVLGVSGGRDSVCLLHLLLNLGHRVHAAHLNHGLRGRASDGDEQFVRKLCEAWNVPISVTRVEVAKKAKQHQLSMEEAARVARYRFFLQVARKQKIRKVAVAHHQRDQAETVLLRIVQGCDHAQLRGMQMERKMLDLDWTRRARECAGLRLVRPMLEIPFEEIELYARQNKLPFREDRSNRDVKIPRNWIRAKLLPLMEKGLNRNVVKSLARLGKT